VDGIVVEELAAEYGRKREGREREEQRGAGKLSWTAPLSITLW
jgi:hypothetical protein